MTPGSPTPRSPLGQVKRKSCDCLPSTRGWTNSKTSSVIANFAALPALSRVQREMDRATGLGLFCILVDFSLYLSFFRGSSTHRIDDNLAINILTTNGLRVVV